MTLGMIELKPEESELLDQIDFKWQSLDDGRRSCVACARLMQLLLDRDAIPDRRLRYFTDPELNGGKKSRMEQYEENGTKGADIFSHGGFLKYLRYFVHGASLDEAVKIDMAKLVGDPSYFSGGDLEPVRKQARALARSSGRKSAASDDFMMLMNDIGLSPYYADSVRRAVLSVK